MLLITGAQRSGTRYLATVLARAGIDATHEGNDPERGDWRDHDPRNGPRRDVAVDVCWHSAWWVAYGELPEATVVHLVREPLASITSSVSLRTFWRPRPSGKWAAQRIPSLARGSNVHRCALYWREWNLLIEPHADERLRIEDATTSTLSILLDKAGVDHDLNSLVKAVDDTPQDVNTDGPGSRRPVEWDDIPDPVRIDVGLMAARYGYGYG